MSRPLAKVENQDPQFVELTKRAKIEELIAIIAEFRARRAEADARLVRAHAETAALKANLRQSE